MDIGGGTTDLAVFAKGSIQHTAVIPIAGDQVTNDIAVALRTPTQHAEEIKVKYACALSQLASCDSAQAYFTLISSACCVGVRRATAMSLVT